MAEVIANVVNPKAGVYKISRDPLRLVLLLPEDTKSIPRPGASVLKSDEATYGIIDVAKASLGRTHYAGFPIWMLNILFTACIATCLWYL